MQFQADIENAEIVRPVITETTALGAAYLAGLAVGYYDSLDEIKGYWKADRRFKPGITEDKRETPCRLEGCCGENESDKVNIKIYIERKKQWVMRKVGGTYVFSI